MYQGESAQGNSFQEISSNGKLLLDYLEHYEEDGNQQVTHEAVNDIFLCPFIDDIYQYARDCILAFFKGKSHYNGGDIPLGEVTSDDRVQMVINTTICAASRTAYDGFLNATWIDKKSSHEGVPGEDVRILLSVFNECAWLNIPKYFAGGIALLCLEFCEGVQIPYHKIREYLAEEYEEGWYIQYEDEDGNIVEDHNPNKEDLEGVEKEDEFCLHDVLVDYGLPK